MTRAGLTNPAASVHRRLLNLSQTRGENFNLLLVQYALERFLYRLAQSGYAHQQWKAFLRRNQLDVGGADFAQIVDILGYFLLPPLAAIADGREFAGDWPPGGPWVAGAD